MSRFGLSVVLAMPLLAGDTLYELSGRLAPPEHALVSLFGATEPFQASTEIGAAGRYRFRDLRAGTYTIALYVPGRGEARETVEVGRGTADGHRRVTRDLAFHDSDFILNDAIRRRNTVSTRQLAIPDAALREYQEAAKDLEKHQVEAATRRLQHAVELAEDNIRGAPELVLEVLSPASSASEIYEKEQLCRRPGSYLSCRCRKFPSPSAIAPK